nr:hypothetical protein CFP56_72079 [Quercus suber]
MAGDALNCFTSLLEHVPTWIADLEHILHTAKHRQHDILTAEQPVPNLPDTSTRSSSLLRSRRTKTIQKDEAAVPTTSDVSQIRPQLPHMTNSDVLRLRQRKRKTLSVCSAGQSGSPKYRSKALVVVYYDGDVQKRFENLVRAVAACRNTIRKGKMSAKVDALSRTGSSSSEGEGNSGGEDGAVRFGGLNYKSTRNTGRTCFAKSNDTEAFDKIDGSLEKGQLLCEKAAHQILRDGDCSVELHNARIHFEDATKLAQAEIPMLQKKAEKAEARRRRSEERVSVERSLDRKPRLEPISVPDIVTMLAMPSDAKLEVDLEADDDTGTDDDDKGDFVLPVLPASIGRYRMQTSRLYAH